MSLRREQSLKKAMGQRKFDVVIIGAGINGIGVFRDLALQGIDCLIADMGDFCSGASGASSRVIHGGLKYLETGDFHLVSQATIERNRLLKNAPHMVRPIEVVIPLYSWFGGIIPALTRFFGWPAKLGGRGGLIIKLGLVIFDQFGRRERATPKHRFMSRGDLLKSMPRFDPKIIASANYFDAIISQPERLGIELLVDAISVNENCIALNYVRLVSIEGKVLQFRDEISGQLVEVEPRVVVNAGGPWVDGINGVMQNHNHYIGGSKGSHIILEHKILRDQLAGRLVAFSGSDGRECFVYHLQDKVLLGSTDIRVDSPDEVCCEKHEIDYLLEALRTAFPGIEVERSDIVFSYCGVRPLPFDAARNPSDVTRDHTIHLDAPGPRRPYPVLSLVGGKWTTFRQLAEEATNLVLTQLDNTRLVSTRNMPIGGGHQFSGDAVVLNALLAVLVKAYQISESRAKLLVERYGSKAPIVARFCNDHADQTIPSFSTYTVKEIEYLTQNEMVEHVQDILLRRTNLAISGEVTKAMVKEIAAIVGSVLGWSKKQISAEAALATRQLVDLHHVDMNGRSYPI
jgi:glycerol-3-phosphate dehydrogenase